MNRHPSAYLISLPVPPHHQAKPARVFFSRLPVSQIYTDGASCGSSTHHAGDLHVKLRWASGCPPSHQLLHVHPDNEPWETVMRNGHRFTLLNHRVTSLKKIWLNSQFSNRSRKEASDWAATEERHHSVGSSMWKAMETAQQPISKQFQFPSSLIANLTTVFHWNNSFSGNLQISATLVL